MNDLYQFVIYDMDEYCDCNEGIMVEISNLYRSEEKCREEAQSRVNELHNEYERDDKFQYELINSKVVD